MRRALHAEWTKLRTTAGPAWLAVATFALTVAVAAIATSSHEQPSSSHRDLVRLALAGTSAGQAAVAGLAALVMCAEYSNGMITTTLQAVPRRLTVLAAKAGVLAGVVVPVGIAAVLLSVVLARLGLPHHGYTASNGYRLISLTDPATMRACFGAVVYLLLVGLLTLGVAAAVRDAAGTIGIVLGLLYTFPIVAALVANKTWHRHLEQIGPTTAGQSIEAATNLGSLVISPWAGLGVLAAWATGVVLIGAALLVVRDA